MCKLYICLEEILVRYLVHLVSSQGKTLEMTDFPYLTRQNVSNIMGHSAHLMTGHWDVTKIPKVPLTPLGTYQLLANSGIWLFPPKKI